MLITPCQIGLNGTGPFSRNSALKWNSSNIYFIGQEYFKKSIREVSAFNLDQHGSLGGCLPYPGLKWSPPRKKKIGLNEWTYALTI